MKITEIVAKNNGELNSLLDVLKKESFNLRFQKISGQLNNTSRVSTVKKTIARIYTVFNQRKLKQSGAN